MQDVTEISHEFETLGLDPTAKRRCLATHLSVAGICALLGAAVGAAVSAAVKEAVRQECPGLVNSLQNASLNDTVVPPSGGWRFADGPGENVLIPSLGRQPQRNVLLTTMQTAETFELSFDITPHDSAPADEWRNIVHFGNYGIQRLPGFWLYPGSTRLRADMNRKDMEIVSCNPDKALPVGQVTRVGVRLVGDTFTVPFNGQQVCSTGGFFENRVPAQPSVPVWFSDPWYASTDVTVANLVYKPLYECECGPVG